MNYEWIREMERKETELLDWLRTTQQQVLETEARLE